MKTFYFEDKEAFKRFMGEVNKKFRLPSPAENLWVYAQPHAEEDGSYLLRLSQSSYYMLGELGETLKETRKKPKGPKLRGKRCR